MEIATFLKLLSQTDGFGFGFFVFGCFSQFFNLIFLCCLLVLGFKFLFFKGSSLFVQYLEKIYLIPSKIDCFNSFNRKPKDCNNGGFVSKSYLVDEFEQKKPIILHWTSDSADGLSLSKKTSKICDLSKNGDIAAALLEIETKEKNRHSEEEESDEDQVFDVITLRKMVKKERKRGDCLKLELEKDRRAAESAAEEVMDMLLKLRIEKSVVEMEAIQYKRVAEQKQMYDQEVIQSLQWMLKMKLDYEEIEDEV